MICNVMTIAMDLTTHLHFPILVSIAGVLCSCAVDGSEVAEASGSKQAPAAACIETMTVPTGAIAIPDSSAATLWIDRLQDSEAVLVSDPQPLPLEEFSVISTTAEYSELRFLVPPGLSRVLVSRAGAQEAASGFRTCQTYLCACPKCERIMGTDCGGLAKTQ